jgi:cohesin complex subunit SCC1
MADGVPLEDGEEMSYADLACPIAAFDLRPSTQSQAMEKEAEKEDGEGKGYSRNTVKALGIIRKELQPAVGAEEAVEKVLSFRKMSDKVPSTSFN